MDKTIRGKRESLSYIAGFVDGEGCIGIVRRRFEKNPKWHTRFNPKLTIVNTNLAVLQMIKETFGGSITQKKQYSEKHNISYALSITDRKAVEAIKSIHKFLIVKVKQADKVLEFSETYQRYIPGRGKFISEEHYQKRIKCYDDMKKLNSRTRRD